MNPDSNDWARLLGSIEALRREVGLLGERVSAIESALAAPVARPAPAHAASATGPAAEPLDEELVLAIGAAVAAFLGVRAHVRQIRLVGSAAWAQQGRATIQASHALAARHAGN